MKLGLTQEQTLKLTPQQILLSTLLQLPMQILENNITQELENNPILEIDEEATLLKQQKTRDAETEREQSADKDPEYDWDAVFDRDGKNEFIPRSDFDASKEEINTPQADELRLFDRVLEQIKTSGMSDEDMSVAEYILWNLDDNGYLSVPVSNIAFILEKSEEDVLRALRILQRLDPVGIAARNLQECLLIQLEVNHEEPYVIDLIRDHFDDFANHRFENIMRSMQIDEEDLKYAQKVISQLNPKPGDMDSTFSNHYIVPDIIVTEEHGEFIITINDGNIPELRLSKSYENMIMHRESLDRETRDYLNKKVESARWFIQSIHQRRNTMMRVMKAIIERQRDFFMGNADGLKPMILKDIAEMVSMDISTISRVTNGKYVQSPMGLHELKFFFTEGMKDAEGEDVSTRKIKNSLRRIIEAENKSKPFNDEKLVKELAKEGYNIARRTVAKYREQMNLPIARLRREI